MLSVRPAVVFFFLNVYHFIIINTRENRYTRVHIIMCVGAPRFKKKTRTLFVSRRRRRWFGSCAHIKSVYHFVIVRLSYCKIIEIVRCISYYACSSISLYPVWKVKRAVKVKRPNLSPVAIRRLT